MSLVYRFYRLLWSGLDWLYPPSCGGCNEAGFRWCPNCQRASSCLPDPVCEVCGLPQPYSQICGVCAVKRPRFTALRSKLIFEGPIRHAMHKLKYSKNAALGEAMAQDLASYALHLGWEADLVVPVPLGKKRFRERGYNQAATIAMPLAAIIHSRYSPLALKRIKETISQVGLSAELRQENMQGAFYANAKLVGNKCVLLIDDIATTGATLSACAEALFNGGTNAVYALTMARALPRHGLINV